MSYNVLDLVDKAINIADRKKTLYSQFINSNDIHLKILATVLLKNSEKTIEFYKNFKIVYNNELDEEIDFSIYDRISFLVNEFKSKISPPTILNNKDLFLFALDFEKQVLGLYLDIQGRLIKNEKDSQSAAYKVLSDIIFHKKQNIQSLEEYFVK